MKITLPFVLAICLLLWNACSTDIDLTAEWKDIPIVYGFVNVLDTAHYIRVEKAFLDPEGDARTIAQNPDSLFYDNATVAMEIVNTGQTFPMEVVDGNLEGYQRDEGAFANTPNILYKLNAETINLEGGEPIRLVINRGDNLPLVTAETNVLEPMEPRMTTPSNPMKLENYLRDFRISWTVGDFAEVFDIRMAIHYKESEPNNNNVFVDKTVEWVMDKRYLRDVADSERVIFDVLVEDFYLFLGNNLEPTQDRSRIFIDADLIITGAGNEINDLLRISEANIGITSSQSVPQYTNISEGLGIFTSRTTAIREGLTLSPISMDSLRNGIHTATLNFK